jgi:hypothetical protein
VTPSAQKIAATYAGMNGNNFGAAAHNNISSKIRKELPAFNITQLELTERVQAVMREFAGNENAIGKITSALQCSDGTAKNYLEGKTTPQGIYDARALAVIPGYLSLKAELAGLEMALDPKHQVKVAEFMRYCQQAADKIFGESA